MEKEWQGLEPEWIAKYKQSKDGYNYVGYDKLTQADTKALAEAVNKLGEPLSQMGIILGK